MTENNIEAAFLSSLKLLHEKVGEPHESLSDKWEKFKGMLPEIDYVLFEVTVGADSFNHLAIAKTKDGQYLFLKSFEKDNKIDLMEMKKETALRQLLIDVRWFSYFELLLNRLR